MKVDAHKWTYRWYYRYFLDVYLTVPGADVDGNSRGLCGSIGFPADIRYSLLDGACTGENANCAPVSFIEF